MPVVLANFATSLLASTITDTATSLVITSGDEGKFPSPGAGEFFPVVVVDSVGNVEVMKCTARSGVTLTVLRGQEGTVGFAFSAGARVSCRLTAAALAELLDRENHTGTQPKSTIVDLVSDLASIATDLAAHTAALANRVSISGGTATSVVGRAAGSSGDRADIAATSDNTFLARVSGALAWTALTIGMIGDGLITFAKMASAAIATANEFRAATASKLLSAASVWDGAKTVALTDGANIAVNLNAGWNFGGDTSGNPLLLAGSRALDPPSNAKDGQSGRLVFGASGSTRTLTPNAAWLIADGVEEGPWSITTTQTLVVAYHCIGTAVWVTSVLRRG